MSDLQTALIALGALIIAGVVLYNWLQERKMRRNINDEFIVPQKDILTEDFYIDTDAYVDKALADVPSKAKITEKLHEIELSSEAKGRKLPISEVDEDIDGLDSELEKAVTRAKIELSKLEPTVHIPPIDKTIPLSAQPQKPATSEQNENSSFTSPLPSEIHPQIDLTAFLFAPVSINTQTLNTMANNIADEMGVPMMVHGLDHEGKWHAVKASTSNDSFKQVACSMQLADRGGPVSKHLLNKFQFSIENMGLELGAHVEWQGSGDAMQRAIDLDKFCMEVDQMVSVHLVQGEAPVHGTKFRGLAESCGMKLGEGGKFYFYAPNNPETPQFILINTDNLPFTSDSLRSSVVKGATFQIEIPKVSNCDQVFSQMVQVAQKMANSLGARMVDDNNKPLGDLQIEKIRQQLKVIHATMLARGVMPGSPCSARLFN